MNVFLDMVGCRLNQAEIEKMAQQFRSAGHEIISSPEHADLVVINTCAVTTAAVSDSRQKIRQAARSGAKKIISTGCWSTLQPQQNTEIAPNILVIPNFQKEHLVSDFLNEGIQAGAPNLPNPIPVFEHEPISRFPIPGLRQRTRAFIKAQDGCNNQCTFCITTIARGTSISRPSNDVIADIRTAANGGVQEIVLTGVHLGSWGQEINMKLRDLVAHILAETDVPRLRLSSLEPWDVDENFFELWNDSRLCPHLHLPLQSGSHATLRRMARKTTPESFMKLVTTARTMIPNVAITTDIIAGFPGEDEQEFNETTELIKELNLAGGHVFSYSARPGTPAARIKDQVPLEVRKFRSHILRTILDETSAAYRKEFIGKTMSVLWEASAVRNETGWQIEGLTENYIRVRCQSPQLRRNQIDSTLLTAVTDSGMVGILNS